MTVRATHECPVLVVRMPATGTPHDHLICDQDAAGTLTGDPTEVTAMCGDVITPAPSLAWRRLLCERCMERLQGSTVHSAGRHLLRQPPNKDLLANIR